MSEKQPAPDWAPDGCPPNVVKLIDDEQYLHDLRLRGLSSADSAELHQAIRQLKRQFAASFETGKVQGLQMRAQVTQQYRAANLVIGFSAGAVIGALGVMLLLA